MKSLLIQIMLIPISFKAFIILYRYLCMRYVNVFKIDMNYDCCFDNVKFKRCLYCVNKKESCVLVSTPNFFSAMQLIRYPPNLSPMLIIAVAFRFCYIEVQCFY